MLFGLVQCNALIHNVRTSSTTITTRTTCMKWFNVQGAKKTYFQNAARATWYTRSVTSSGQPSQPDLDKPVSGNYIFGRFLALQHSILDFWASAAF